MKLHETQTLQQIANLIGAAFIGKADFQITGINEIHMVEPGDLTFVDHPKYYSKALSSKATTVLINTRDVVCPEGKTLLFSDEPFRDYNYLTKYFRAPRIFTENIHASAKIGEGTTIAPGVCIGENVVIGNNTIIHPNVVIYDHCQVGNNVTIHANASIGSDAFYFKKYTTGYTKMHSCGRVIIDDNVEIGSNCSIDKGVSGDTIIGNGTKLDNQIHIAHDVHIGKNCLFATHVAIAGCTTIEDDVILWGKVAVQKDLTIGKGAVVLGMSGVSKSIEGGKTYFGAPVEEARLKWREMAAIRQLPSIIEKLNK
jgi:UDP-3-O-[3-hydroxymyristoyl] glucosamine N-acyltransferase